MSRVVRTCLTALALVIAGHSMAVAQAQGRIGGEPTPSVAKGAAAPAMPGTPAPKEPLAVVRGVPGIADTVVRPSPTGAKAVPTIVISLDLHGDIIVGEVETPEAPDGCYHWQEPCSGSHSKKLALGSLELSASGKSELTLTVPKGHGIVIRDVVKDWVKSTSPSSFQLRQSSGEAPVKPQGGSGCWVETPCQKSKQ